MTKLKGNLASENKSELLANFRSIQDSNNIKDSYFRYYFNQILIY